MIIYVWLKDTHLQLLIFKVISIISISLLLILDVHLISAYVEIGSCLNPSKAYGCEDIDEYITGFGGFQNNDFYNCSIDVCNGDLCSSIDFFPPQNCTQSDGK